MANTIWGSIKKTALNEIWPVNSIYISFDHINPTNKFGGSWMRIQDAFLFGVSKNESIGETGGESTHILTENEIPIHGHGLPMIGVSGTSSQSTSLDAVQCGSWTNTYAVRPNVIQKIGEGQAHNNMPPYIQVSIWRRVS